jgi:hypothetical protein
VHLIATKDASTDEASDAVEKVLRLGFPCCIELSEDEPSVGYVSSCMCYLLICITWSYLKLSDSL